MDQLPPASVSFAPPAIASPIEVGGVLFQQDQTSTTSANENGDAYLAAVDARTGQFLWRLKIESAKISIQNDHDHFVQLKSIVAGSRDGELTIISSSNTLYTVDIRKRLVVEKLALQSTNMLPPPPAFNMPQNASRQTLPNTVDYQSVHYRQAIPSDGFTQAAHASYLVAWDSKSNKLLWSIKIGEKPLDASADEWTPEMMMFSEMEVVPEIDELRIVDFAGRHFHVNIKERTVTQQKGLFDDDMFLPLGSPLEPT